jgi:hypothetical protein
MSQFIRFDFESKRGENVRLATLAIIEDKSKWQSPWANGIIIGHASRYPLKSWFFWLLWGFDALVALGFVYFFVIGLEDGSVSSFNMALWLGILGSLAAILGGGYFLRAKGHGALAACVLCLLAVPALAYVLFFAVLIISNPRWN